MQFVHPLLVRCAIEYRPRDGQTGPVFRDEFILTPDGVLSTVTKIAGGDEPWGVTWPLIVNDGAPLQRSHTAATQSVQYPGFGDRQNFISLNAGAEFVSEAALRSTFGDLEPIRVTTGENSSRTFVYPSGVGDPDAEAVRKSFGI